MVRSITKRVRMSPSEARRLARLARREHRSESEILREGLDLVERRKDRDRGLKQLIAMIDGPEPPKIRWGLKQ